MMAQTHCSLLFSALKPHGTVLFILLEKAGVSGRLMNMGSGAKNDR